MVALSQLRALSAGSKEHEVLFAWLNELWRVKGREGYGSLVIAD